MSRLGRGAGGGRLSSWSTVARGRRVGSAGAERGHGRDLVLVAPISHSVDVGADC